MATKNIIVTGASRGIGHAIATHLLSPALSCNVLLTARTVGPLQELQSAHPSQASYISGDASSPTIAKSIISTAVSKKGRLDGLVLNHGILGQVGKVSETKIEEWERVFAVNVTGTLQLIQAALPELRKSKGRIIFTSSGAAAAGYATLGPYGATKSVLNHIALVLSKEEPNVTTVAVRPGMVDTDLVRGLLEDERADREVKGVRKTARDEGTMAGPGELGRVIARLVLGAGEELSGKFIKWDDERLAAFQDPVMPRASG